MFEKYKLNVQATFIPESNLKLTFEVKVFLMLFTKELISITKHLVH